jgi:hypothetical protein
MYISYDILKIETRGKKKLFRKGESWEEEGTGR